MKSTWNFATKTGSLLRQSFLHFSISADAKETTAYVNLLDKIENELSNIVCEVFKV